MILDITNIECLADVISTMVKHQLSRGPVEARLHHAKSLKITFEVDEGRDEPFVFSHTWTGGL